jgi:hypothetical protein
MASSMRLTWLCCLIAILGCEKKTMIPEKEFVEYVLANVEKIPTLKRVKCPVTPDSPNEFCYGLNLNLVDFAQNLRKSMHDEYQDPPFFQPPMGAYIGRERAKYITLKRDDQKYFSVTYTPSSEDHIKSEEEMGSDMSSVKGFDAYIRIYFVDPTK